MKTWIGLLIAVAVLTGCSSGSSPAPTPTVTVTTTTVATASPTPSIATPVTLTVHPTLRIKPGSHENPRIQAKNFHDCYGVNAFSDLKKGMSVTIYGPSGSRIVGTGFVTRSVVQPKHGYRCDLHATVRHVVSVPFYKVQFGNRNKVAFSRQQLLSRREYEVLG